MSGTAMIVWPSVVRVWGILKIRRVTGDRPIDCLHTIFRTKVSCTERNSLLMHNKFPIPRAMWLASRKNIKEAPSQNKYTRLHKALRRLTALRWNWPEIRTRRNPWEANQCQGLPTRV